MIYDENEFYFCPSMYVDLPLYLVELEPIYKNDNYCQTEVSIVIMDHI